MAVEQFETVYETVTDGRMWREELAVPGTPGECALLAELDCEPTVNATKFQLTKSGDWLATVNGVQYQVLPGVIPETGRFVLIGVEVHANQRPPEPRRVWPKFSGGGGLDCTSSANPDDVRPLFRGTGYLDAEVVRVTKRGMAPKFGSEGTLSLKISKIAYMIVPFGDIVLPPPPPPRKPTRAEKRKAGKHERRISEQLRKRRSMQERAAAGRLLGPSATP